MIYCAEVGSCHKGIPALAYEMIHQAALAGADIVKFQFGHYHPNEHLDEVTDMRTQLMRYAPMEWYRDLADWCEQWNIELMASIFSTRGLEAAREIGMKRYKMASPQAFAEHSFEDYHELLEEMKKDDKEIFSTGSMDLEYAKMHPIFAVSEYPTYPADYHQPHRYSATSRKEFWYGYSSHVHGIADALVAISRGAQYVEKHVTLNKTETSIKDNAFALSFDEFRQMRLIGREIEAICS